MGKETKEVKEKCFVIMPISDQGDYPKGHFHKVYEQIFIPAIEDAGYEAYRVDQNKISDPIINKIFDAIQNCPMAICDLSNKNPNVLYELGLRQAYDKPVVLIQDEKTDRIFDVSGINTVYYESARKYEDVFEARKKITEALVATRDGKNQSMVKVMKAKSADYSEVSVSNDDKTQIMLSQILSKLDEGKNVQLHPVQNSAKKSFMRRQYYVGEAEKYLQIYESMSDEERKSNRRLDVIYELQKTHKEIMSDFYLNENDRMIALERIATIISVLKESKDK